MRYVRPTADPDDVHCGRCGHDHLKGGRDVLMPPCRAEGCGRVHPGCNSHRARGPSGSGLERKLPADAPDTPCNAIPGRGSPVCKAHGGRTPRVLHAARTRRQEQDLQRAMLTMGERSNASPAEMAIEELEWTHGYVRWLRQIIQATPDDELFWGLAEERHEGGDGEGGEATVAVTATYRAAPSVVLTEYGKERDRLFRMLGHLSSEELNQAVQRWFLGHADLLRAGLVWLLAEFGYGEDASPEERRWAIGKVTTMLEALDRGEVPATARAEIER